ncbi:MAG: MerR family transcriptional regulator [Myxococcota bacterium]
MPRKPVEAELAGRPGRSPEPTHALALRMRDLVRESGLPRETIHFYLKHKLLPPGRKTGRNTAVYGPAHVDRLRRIRELQARQFLPLKAIRAILEGTTEPGFTPEQKDLLKRVRTTLVHSDVARSRRVPLAEATGGRVTAAEVRELRATGMIDLEGAGPNATVSAEDAEVIAVWAEMKAIGYGPERGFHPSQLEIYDRAIARLYRDEGAFYRARLGDVSAEAVASLIERTEPLVVRLLAVLHRKYLRASPPRRR